MLSEQIMYANTIKVINCHCEEFDDPFGKLRAGVAISVQVRITYRAGQHCSCRRRRCPYRVVDDCHAWPELVEWVVELLAMTEGRALLPLASLQTVNNVRGQYM